METVRVICQKLLYHPSQHGEHMKQLFHSGPASAKIRNMKNLTKMILACFLIPCLFMIRTQGDDGKTVYEGKERTVPLNDGWKYLSWDQSPEDLLPEFGVDVILPHDFMIAQEFSEEGEAESAFLKGGIAWYARYLILSESCADRAVMLDFDGVYHQAEIYVNGTLAAQHPYGYSPFSVDISGLAVCDGEFENIIAVRVDTSEPSSRWYAGGGILRDVSLTVTSPVSFEKDGVAVTYDESLKKDGEDCPTHISAEIINRGEKEKRLKISVELYDESGRCAASAVSKTYKVPSGETSVITCDLEAASIRQWRTDRPALYQARVCLLDGEEIIDEVSETYGYRWTAFDPDSGFFLNGEPVKLKGVCLHQDLGALGAADHPSLWAQRLRKLREMGCNAIRIAHDPASKNLIRLCTQTGILVIEEAFDTWTYPKNWNLRDHSSCFSQETGQTRLAGVSPQMTWAEADLKAMIRRDRNDPSVILWSLGNEILGNIGAVPEEYPDIAEMLSVWARECDTTRPLTIGDNKTDGKSEIQNRMDANIVSHGGIIGLNYASAKEYDSLHKKNPDVVFYGSETASELSSRSWYGEGTDEEALQLSSRDEETVEWGSTARQAWLDVISRDFIAGEFVWTGYDYLGEPEPWNGVQAGSVSGSGPLPRSSYFGILDTAGFAKDAYYFCQSQWRDDITVLHVLPDWQEGLSGKVNVTVYTNAPEVELFLNGQTLGRKKAEMHRTAGGYGWKTYDNDLAASWDVEYEAGTLEAVAYDENGERITGTSGISLRQSAGEPAALVFDVKRLRFRDGDVLRLPLKAVDENGNETPADDILVTFSCEGCEALYADNGNAADGTPYIFSGTQTQRKLFRGCAAAFVKAADDAQEIILKAEADGLETAVIRIPKDR